MKLFFYRLVLLSIWVVISFSVAAEAGDSAVFGHLMPSGPSFMAGEYVHLGFWSNDVELYLFGLWFFGLITFFLNHKWLGAYLLSLLISQTLFINMVNDALLTLTGYVLLMPVEVLFVMASIWLIKKKSQVKLY